MRKKIIAGIIACLLCSEAFAYIFDVIPSDKSQQYLGLVFGSTVGAINLVAASNNITLSMMFQNFNFIIVTIGAIVLGYLAVVSTINTAREGKAMGEKISMWVPLRALFGMLMMIPGPSSGYSVIQMSVLWIVLNGIGAANSVWNVVVAQLAQGVTLQGVSTQSLPPTTTTSAKSLVQNVFYASTCMHSINNMTDLLQRPGPLSLYGPVQVYTVMGPTPTQPTIVNGDPNNLQLTQTAYVKVGLQGSGVPPGLDALCGQFTVNTTLSNQITSSTFNYATLAQITTIKINAVKAVFSSIDSAASIMASTATGNQYVAPTPGFSYAGTQAYLGQITTMMTGVQAAAGQDAPNWATNPVPLNNSTSPISSALQGMQQVGWIHAGSFYYMMVQASTPTIDPATTTVPTSGFVPAAQASTWTRGTNPTNPWPLLTSGTTPSISGLLDSDHQWLLNTSLGHTQSYWNIDSVNATATNPQLSGTPISTGNPILDPLVQGFANNIQNPIISGIQNMMTGDPNTLTTTVDPLVAMARFGNGMMLAAELSTLVMIGMVFILMIVGSIASCVNPVPWAAISIIGQLTPILLGGFGLMWTAGATLGIYVPLIPYLVFTTSAFGWIIAVIEAMVGAPLIALGLVHPSGEELGKAESALVILANLFLRPTLMIFGFVMGIGLLRAGIALVNYGFIPALTSSTLPSMLSVIAVLGLYCTLIISLVNKSFSLIYMLPNQIMRWMGGQAESSDPSDMVKEAKGGFDAGAEKAQGVNTAVSQKARDQASSAGSKHSEAKKDNEDKTNKGWKYKKKE